jgi:preprotein translocase subunit SecB
VEATQAAVFQIRNVPQQDLGSLLGIACPNTLFPYVREAISAVTTRAGFPPMVLAPMSFEAIYQQQQTPSPTSKPN